MYQMIVRAKKMDPDHEVKQLSILANFKFLLADLRGQQFLLEDLRGAALGVLCGAHTQTVQEVATDSTGGQRNEGETERGNKSKSAKNDTRHVWLVRLVM